MVEDDEKLMEKYTEFIKKIFTFLPTQPYQFFVKYLEVIEETSPLMEYPTKDILDFSKELQRRMSKARQDINKELRLVEIEEDLIPLIESTDNKIFYRPLFFPTVFINNEFIFENFIIKGILIEDIPNKEDLLICSMAYDTETKIILVSLSSIMLKLNLIQSYLPFEKNTDRLYEYIRILVCNTIDMVEGNDFYKGQGIIVAKPYKLIK